MTDTAGVPVYTNAIHEIRAKENDVVSPGNAVHLTSDCGGGLALLNDQPTE